MNESTNVVKTAATIASNARLVAVGAVLGALLGLAGKHAHKQMTYAPKAEKEDLIVFLSEMEEPCLGVVLSVTTSGGLITDKASVYDAQAICLTPEGRPHLTESQADEKNMFLLKKGAF